MAAAVVAAPSPAKGLATVTLTLTGFAATQPHNIVVLGPSGSSWSRAVTTDGAGAATATYVPQHAGSYTVNVYQTTQTVAATTGFNSSGN